MNMYDADTNGAGTAPAFIRLAAAFFALFAGVAAMSSAFAADQGEAAMHTPLTMENLRAFVAASANLQAVAAKHPELEDRISAGVDESFQQSVERFQEPHLKKALADAGLTPVEYATLDYALINAALGMIYKKSSGGELDKVYDRHNVEFLETHKKELEQLKKEYGLQDD
ncbi:MAG TPA: hypothetical protein VFL54_05185 [Gammaproteobacteria bacterium]|nr:hypothetical protein [Gammaproteobacteria bacterium]